MNPKVEAKLRQGWPRRSGWAVIVALPATVLGPAAAQAAFPGGLGQILYTCASSSEDAAHLCAVDGDGSGNRRVATGGSDGAWSPDGVHYAYIKQAPSELTGANPVDRIHISRINGASAIRRLEIEGRPSSPAWSPDGQRIAFANEGRGGDASDIYVTDLEGKVQDLTAGVSAADQDPAWSPDGRHIAFASNREDGHDEIYTVDVANGSITRVTRAPAGGSSAAPNWSPDGSRLAFVREQTGQEPLPEGTASDVWAVNADGSAERPVTNRFGAGERNVKAFFPAWSPDGGRIAFSLDTPDQENSLRVVGADGSGETALGVTGFQPDWGPAEGTGPAQPLAVPQIGRVSLKPRVVWAAPPDTVRPSARDGATLRFRMSSAGFVGLGAQRMRGRRPRGKPTVIARFRARAGSNRLHWLGVYSNGIDVPRGSYRLVLVPINLLGDTGRQANSPTFRMAGNCLERTRRPCRVR